LSITTAPAFRAAGTNSLERVAPALKKAKSTPAKAAASSLRTWCFFPARTVSVPAERSLASGTSFPTGNFLRSSTRRISCPTAPVTPTTATL